MADFEDTMAQRFGVRRDDVKRLWGQKRREVNPVTRPKPGQGGFQDVVGKVIGTLRKDTGRK